MDRPVTVTAPAAGPGAAGPLPPPAPAEPLPRAAPTGPLPQAAPTGPTPGVAGGGTAAPGAGPAAPGASPATVAPGADVDPRATLGPGTRVWHLAQVREGAVVGADCVLGRGSYVGPGARVGDRCKVQNHALVYEPAVLEDGAFVGPGAVLTNDLLPRAVNPDGSLKTADDWHAVGVTVRAGASVGARAVCVAPVVIGRWALVAAGAVVTRDVPDHALVVGVPARRVAWVGRTGERLVPDGPGRWRCPATGEKFAEVAGGLAPARAGGRAGDPAEDGRANGPAEDGPADCAADGPGPRVDVARTPRPGGDGATP